MSENPLIFSGGADPVRASTLQSDVVFIDVGSRKIESKVIRDGVPIGVHTIDQDILNDIVIGEPIIAYRIVAQTVAPGTPVPLGTAIDVVMARPGTLPVSVVAGTHQALQATTIDDAFARLVAGKPDVVRLVARAAGAPLSREDEEALRVTFRQAQIEITDRPGSDVEAGLETLRMLTTFGPLGEAR